MSRIYLIGSLKHPIVPLVAADLRAAGHDVFDDWHGCGPEADMKWEQYEKARGRSFVEALASPLARHAFNFDMTHIDAAEVGVLAFPAGKSGHLELGLMLGQGKPGYILFDREPEHWDVMYLMARGIFYDVKQLIGVL